MVRDADCLFFILSLCQFGLFIIMEERGLCGNKAVACGAARFRAQIVSQELLHCLARAHTHEAHFVNWSLAACR